MIQPAGFRWMPEVVKNLLIINGLMFLAKYAVYVSLHVDLEDLLGLHYFGGDAFELYQFVTYQFIHANLEHIFMNMLVLWMFGSAIEQLWGGKRFLIYYLLTGFGAAMVHYTVVHFELYPVLSALDHYLENPSLANLQLLRSEYIIPTNWQGSTLHPASVAYQNALEVLKYDPTNAAALNDVSSFLDQIKTFRLNKDVVIGASGAVWGVLLAFGLFFREQYIYLYFLFPIKAKWLVLGLAAYEVFAIVMDNPTDNVAHFAHLGGALFGFILIKLWRLRY